MLFLLVLWCIAGIFSGTGWVFLASAGTERAGTWSINVHMRWIPFTRALARRNAVLVFVAKVLLLSERTGVFSTPEPGSGRGEMGSPHISTASSLCHWLDSVCLSSIVSDTSNVLPPRMGRRISCHAIALLFPQWLPIVVFLSSGQTFEVPPSHFAVSPQQR